MAANQSLDELQRLYLERTLSANAIGGPGSQDVTVTNVATSPVPVDITDVDMNLLAKEATLEAVRVQTAAINANTDAVEALLTTIRDTVYRRTDPLPAGTNTIGRVVDAFETVTLLNLPSAIRTVGGVEGPYSVANVSRVAFDVDVTATSGVGQSLILHIERQGADGIWYPIYTSPSMSAVGKASTSIGQGMTVGQSIGSTLRMRYTITGTTPSFTFSASLVGK